MKKEAQGYLGLARESLDAARFLLEHGHHRIAASRAYYAMFYTANALLAWRGKSYRRHSGVIAAFGRNFAKSGDMNPKYHRWLINAYRLRTVSDYAIADVPPPSRVEEVLAWAEEFLKAGQDFLAKRPMEE